MRFGACNSQKLRIFAASTHTLNRMTEPTLSMPDLYMPMLARLCDDDKIVIIRRLLASMHHPDAQPRPDVSTLFSGDWENDIPADVLADQYRYGGHYDSKKEIEW